MIAHSNEFKQELKTFARRYKNKISVYDNLLLATESNETILTESELELIAKVSDNDIKLVIDDENIYYIKLIRKGEILSTLMKELDFESDLDLDIGNIIDYKFGLQINNTDEYIDFGKYIIFKKEYNADTKTYSYICYDFMLKAMITIGTEFSFYDAPTGYDMLPKICDILGIDFDNSLVEQDNETPTPYGMIKNLTYNINIDAIREAKITYRDLLNILCQYFGVSMYVENNELKIKLLGTIENNNGWVVNNDIPYVCDTLNSDFFKEKNVVFKDKYGKINALNVSGTDETKTQYIENTQSINDNGLTLFEVKNNLILSNTTIWDEYSNNIANNIFELIDGVSFNLCDFNTFGILYLEWLDYFNVIINETTYNCLLLNSEITIKSGITESIYTELPEKNVSEYTTSPKSNDIIADTIRARGNAYANGYKLVQEDEIIGKIFISGNTLNGNYIKYADGTMICWETQEITTAIDTQWGSMYESTSKDLGVFPVNFIAVPNVQATISLGYAFIESIVNTTSNLWGQIILCSGVSISVENTYKINLIAIGKWK